MSDLETRWAAFVANPAEFPTRVLPWDGDEPADKLLDMLHELSAAHYASTYLAGIEGLVWVGVTDAEPWSRLFPPSASDDLTRDQLREAIMAAGGMVLREWTADGQHRFGSIGTFLREVDA